MYWLTPGKGVVDLPVMALAGYTTSCAQKFKALAHCRISVHVNIDISMYVFDLHCPEGEFCYIAAYQRRPEVASLSTVY